MLYYAVSSISIAKFFRNLLLNFKLFSQIRELCFFNNKKNSTNSCFKSVCILCIFQLLKLEFT